MENILGQQSDIDKAFNGSVFRPQKRWDWPVLVVYVLINFLVLINAVGHASYRGYDSNAFMMNIKIMSQGHLPDAQHSTEYFSPPLPFVLPALTKYLFGLSTSSAAKIGQLSQVFLSLGLTYLLLKICRRVGLERSATFCTLVFLGILPVYYRTFAMVRGEPWVIFFLIFALDQSLAILIERRVIWWRIVGLGVALGLGLLSRQWAIFFVPVLLVMGGVVFWKYPNWRGVAVRSVSVSLLIAFIISSWFYFHLKSEYGSFRAFNQEPVLTFSLQNQPASFYFDLNIKEVLTQPYRPHLSNRFWPIMYTDTFGDYWGYFMIYAYDHNRSRFWPVFIFKDSGNIAASHKNFETNHLTVVPYLASVARVSLYPATIMVLGFCFVLIELCRPSGTLDLQKPVRLLLLIYLLLVAVTMVGYGWFLIMYPNLEKGDTIKPTYILHVFPFFAICAGCLMGKIKKKQPMVYRLMLVMLGFVVVHNLPVMVSHNGPLRYCFRWLTES